jgi:hypothetical protein
MGYDKCHVCGSSLGTTKDKEEEAICWNCYYGIDYK